MISQAACGVRAVRAEPVTGRPFPGPQQEQPSPQWALCGPGGAQPAAGVVQQESPRQASWPSLTARAAMTRAAMGSAQDRPRVALRTRPTRSTADRWVHRSVCLESATVLAEPSSGPARRCAAEETSMTESSPKPIRALEEAMVPAVIATTASMML
ncbi:hypothetical protein ADL00_08305 [Streptomyces sp. AS58]|nr:hypothetical protein ADL00_08305 [Streptomyces sp. AS58]